MQVDKNRPDNRGMKPRELFRIPRIPKLGKYVMISYFYLQVPSDLDSTSSVWPTRQLTSSITSKIIGLDKRKAFLHFHPATQTHCSYLSASSSSTDVMTINDAKMLFTQSFASQIPVKEVQMAAAKVLFQSVEHSNERRKHRGGLQRAFNNTHLRPAPAAAKKNNILSNAFLLPWNGIAVKP